jgi:glutamyl endopeptidase
MRSFHEKGLRNALMYACLLCALIFVAAPLARAQEAAKLSDPQRAVSSDGASFTASEYAQQVLGETGFEGTAAEGFASDAEAEFPRRTESAKEVWALWNSRPANGKVGIESIIGADTRVLINPTTSYPARAVALITFNQNGSSYRCTGWLYGKDVVATAGHCVHTGGPGGSWSTNVRVYPGRNGSSSPYGSCTAKRLYSVTGWINSSDERYDYGVVKLNCTIGNTVGWFGYWWQTATLTNLPTLISGYPGDKPLTQWRSTDKVRVTQTLQLFYQNDTVGGMSGSPVYYNRPAGSASCTGYCSMAIHAYGLHGSPPHSTNNHGTRIVQAVFNNLMAWKNAT